MIESCDYDGLDQRVSATACHTFPTIIYLAASGQFSGETTREKPVRKAGNPINRVDPTGTQTIGTKLKEILAMRTGRAGIPVIGLIGVAWNWTGE